MSFHLDAEVLKQARATALQMVDDTRREFTAKGETFVLSRDSDNMMPLGTITVNDIRWYIGVAT
jgi:hypothetical protein